MWIKFYIKNNFSIIPIMNGSKKPAIEWKDFQYKRPDEKVISGWNLSSIGIVTGKISGITVVDIDDMTSADPNILSIKTPTVLTPSGGRHLYFKYYPINTCKIEYGDVKNDGGYVVAPPTSGYKWIHSPITTPLADFPSELIKTNGFTVDTDIPLIEGRRDNDLFHIALKMLRGGTSPEEVKKYIIEFARRCIPPFPEKEAIRKVESAIKFLQKSQAPIIQPAVVPIEERKIDFLNIEEREIIIKMPCQVEKWVRILPKNIIVIAGEPNAGKTAFLLNLLDMNMPFSLPVRYLSSEMGALELRERLKFFDRDLKEWDGIFYEVSEEFDKYVLEDGITLIDFLEVTSEFYRISEYIRLIWNKLRNGVAIIAIQKNADRDIGLGGFRSLEKARLYLSLDHNMLKIVKAKNWKTETNPNGLGIRFKLLHGTKFVPDQWERIK